MRLLAAVALLALAASPSTALASSRTPAEATVHALDELANCYAQHRTECPTATPTPTATVPVNTPSPTSTVQRIETPTPEAIEPTATPEPVCWLTDQDLGDPDNGYVVFDDEGAPIPCPTDAPTEETPIAEPTDTPPPAPTATPRAMPPDAAGSAPTLLPTYTPYPTYTPQPTYTPAPTATPQPATPQVAGAVVTALPTNTATPMPTPSSVAAVVARPQPTTAPMRTAAFSQLRMPSFERPWLYLCLLVLFAVGALAAIWLARRGRRRYAP